MSMINSGLTAVALVLAAAAAPAPAATYVFDVTVSERSGGSGSFVPFAFQQSWSIHVARGTGTVDMFSTGSGQFAMNSREGYVSQLIPTVSSPVTAELLALTGPLDYTNSAVWASQTFREYPGFNLTSSDYSMNLSTLGQFYSDAGGIYTASTYLLQLTVGLGPVQEAAFRGIRSFDAHGLAQVLAAAPLAFTESGTRQQFNGQGAGLVETRYSGTATLRAFVPDVPEPSAWAAMVAGFGVLGALLRRRAALGRVPATA